MTLPIERSRSRRPITWVTLIGVLLLPVVIGGILIAALYDPTERLDNLTAAVVNEDEPVELDGQTVPLGRQLTAGLVEGSDSLDSNLTWVLSNPDDAEEGLEDGTYDAVITIPENFTTAALSTRPGETPEQAVIEVTTAPDSLIVDDAITAQVATTAASVMGEELSTTYLENVLLGFTTLGEQLGEAADGASQLADGAGEAADGTITLADGIDQLAGGAGELSTGAYGISGGIGQLAGGAGDLSSGASGIAGGMSSLATGADDLADGANGISDGVAGVADGASQLADGTAQAAAGLDEWAAGAGATAGGTYQLADGLTQMADEVSALPDVPTEVVTAAQQLADNSEQIKTTVTDAASELTALADQCLAEGGSPELCDAVAQVSTTVNDALPTVTGFLDDSQQLADGVAGLAEFEPQLVAALRQSAEGATQLGDGMTALADGATDAADGVGQLAVGMSDLADGADQLAGGTSTWAAGARQWADGASELAAGTSTWASGAGTWAQGAGTAATGVNTWAAGAGTWAAGATDAASGAGDLADGITQIADGTEGLADGLTMATEEIPSYTEDDADALATVVADPVSASGTGSSLFGASAIPLLAMLALWFGGLGSFIALQAVSRRALTSRTSSAVLALRGLAPAAGIGAAQGLLVAGIVQIAADYAWGDWWVFAGVCVVAGVAFAAVNQALVAALGGAGRWVAAIIGVLAVATGIVSTVPGALSDIAALMPTAPAYNGMLAALTSVGGVGSALVGLAIWAAIGLAVTILVVARRRSVNARALLAAPAAA
ncbi:YhgE/Pip domain-containing protein [Microbacterium sp. C7(2022)]|uniref:YhgE/Pip domain-containing protein n=1 Tax=Microbacterium sp. C7(2022) TaxID=2992759 RepID=UPI00237A234E|nr:YhgE/Pip domain-containing protein [Microbacterium sp. C7(2022)]MDE0546168.1 YhgE/Pip domain-containing protein [Microbacterium sp. C7(2022)]